MTVINAATIDEVTAERSRQIDLCAEFVKLRGFKAGEPIIFRGATETALGEFIVASLGDRFAAAVRCEPEYRTGQYLVVGTKSEADNALIRQTQAAVTALVAAPKV